MARLHSQTGFIGLLFFAIAACHSASEGVPGNRDDHRPWAGIAADETIHFLGTEPFWNGTVQRGSLTYATPENQAGETTPVARFAGRGGLSFSGRLTSGDVTLAVTPGKCSDGMSDAHYPFTVTLRIGEAVRQGCGWTDRQPRQGGTH